jgi:hypothetical protein
MTLSGIELVTFRLVAQCFQPTTLPRAPIVQPILFWINKRRLPKWNGEFMEVCQGPDWGSSAKGKKEAYDMTLISVYVSPQFFVNNLAACVCLYIPLICSISARASHNLGTRQMWGVSFTLPQSLQASNNGPGTRLTRWWRQKKKVWDLRFWWR